MIEICLDLYRRLYNNEPSSVNIDNVNDSIGKRLYEIKELLAIVQFETNFSILSSS